MKYTINDNQLLPRDIDFMDNKNLFKYIKTPCGQAKYIELQSNKSLLGKLRIFWFVIIASIRDWNIKD